jgi:hypothetical protein
MRRGLIMSLIATKQWSGKMVFGVNRIVVGFSRLWLNSVLLLTSVTINAENTGHR